MRIYINRIAVDDFKGVLWRGSNWIVKVLVGVNYTGDKKFPLEPVYLPLIKHEKLGHFMVLEIVGKFAVLLHLGWPPVTFFRMDTILLEDYED